jgi:hypothetical protein
MPIGSDTYVKGEHIYGAINSCSGVIFSVGDAAIYIDWNDGKFPVAYPADIIMIRKAWP